MQVFADIVTEELRFQREQYSKQSVGYVLRAVIRNRDPANAAGFPADSVVNAVMEVEEDFKISYLTGRCEGPTDSAGLRLFSAGTTAFQAAGVTTGRADRGLSLRFMSISTSQVFMGTMQNQQVLATLPRDFIPAETILAPGYGFSFEKPYAMNLFLSKGSRLKMQIRNFDSLLPATQFHSIAMFFYGQRMAS